MDNRRREEELTMKEIYRCEVDCVNCALKIEDKIKKMPEVKDCNISFVTLKCHIDFNDDVDKAKALKQIKKNF